VILKLIDVDEDRCLSIGEVFKMIYIIEKNFVLELNYLNFSSQKLYHEMAYNNSLMKFRVIMTKKHPLDKFNQRFLNQSLITHQEFMRIIKSEDNLLKNMLPKTIDLVSFLKTRFEEKVFEIQDIDVDDFNSFLLELHQEIRGPKEILLYHCEPPGRVQVNRHLRSEEY